MGWPPARPNLKDFFAKCPEFTPAPWDIVSYILGMGDTLLDKDKKWPLVNDDLSSVFTEGILTDIYISPLDWPWYHDSHDLDMKVSLDPAYRWVTLTPFDPGAQVIETESGRFPHFARPVFGDHIFVQGRWIFDCGHEPKTEIHPIYLFESDRIVYRPLYLEGKLQAVRLVRIWMNSNPGAFERELKPLPYNFDFEMPVPGGKIPFLRVVKALNWNPRETYPSSPYAVSAKLVGTKVHVSISPESSYGAYYYELMLGHLAQPLVSPGPSKDEEESIYTVTLTKILVVKSEDKNWYLDVHVNGEWRQIFHDASVSTGTIYPLAIAIPVVGVQLNIGVTGYYVTTGDYGTGESADPPYGFRGFWKEGKLAYRRTGEEYTLNTPNLILYYIVTKGGNVPPILHDDSYWTSRLADEPSVDMHMLSVPPEGAPSTMAIVRYLTEIPLDYDNIRILDRDVDTYTFRLDDFGNVDIPTDSLPAGVNLNKEGYYPDLIGLPIDLQTMLGYVRYQVTVQSASGSMGDRQYTLSITLSWRKLDPDWGTRENLDVIETYLEGSTGSGDVRTGVKGGRLVDLYTDTGKWEKPSASVLLSGGDSRFREMEWAWQHVKGEIHWYDVWFPSIISRPVGQPACEYDEDGTLEINADGMHLSILETGETKNDTLTLGDLNTRYPLGHVHVKVTNPTGSRGVYRFNARWKNGSYYTPKGCELQRNIRRIVLTKPVPWPIIDIHRYTGSGGPSDPPWWKQVDVFHGGGFIIVPEVPQGTLDIIISSARNQPVTARLYDSDNVLVSETMSMDQDLLERRRISVAPGVSSHRRMIAKGLKEGDTYALHIVPMIDLKGVEAVSCRIGISQIRQI